MLSPAGPTRTSTGSSPGGCRSMARRRSLDRVGDVLDELFADLTVYDDALDTAEHLAGLGVPLAVASSSRRRRLDRTLSVTGLDRLFPITVAGDEVENAKPAPDIFLEAARRLGTHPETCFVVEDTPAGVAAGRAAGMTVVAVVRGRYTPEDLQAGRPGGAGAHPRLCHVTAEVWRGGSVTM